MFQFTTTKKPTKMVKPSSSSSHIIQSKFKPWRRGKSTKGKYAGKTTNPSSSLKQQLRGLLRLRDKHQQQDPPQEGKPWSAENEARIRDLQQQIQMRQLSEKERTNATKSHKLRFMDRQRSMRQYKKLASFFSSSLIKNEHDYNNTEANENELYKLALDQMYIAHYPLGDTTYVSLYHGNHRQLGADTVDGDTNQQQRRNILNDRLLFKMAKTRHRALEKSRSDERVSWVPVDQYERIQKYAPERWTTELERTTFGIQPPRHIEKTDESKNQQEVLRKDNRFQVSDQHAQLIDEAIQIEKDLEDAGESSNDQRNAIAETMSHSSDDDDDDEKDSPSVSSIAAKRKEPSKDDKSAVGNEEDDSAFSSSSDSDHSSSESDDSSSVLSPGEDGDENSQRIDDDKTATALLVADGFLTAAVPMDNVFDNSCVTKRPAPDSTPARGDKSKGWATQRQLPGEFRKRRKR